MERTTKERRNIDGQEVIFLTVVSLFWFAQYVYIPYQTAYLSGIGVVGAYGISQLLLRIPVGLCADRVGRHKLFIMTGALASGCASIFRVCLCNANGFLAAAMWISFMVFYAGRYTGEEQQRALWLHICTIVKKRQKSHRERCELGRKVL